MVAQISQTKLERFIKAPESMRNDPEWPLFQAGIDEGRLQMKRLALGFLEKEYLDDAIERGSAKGKAILGLTKELSKYLNDN